MVTVRRTEWELLSDAIAGLLEILDGAGVKAQLEPGTYHGPDAVVSGWFDDRRFTLLVEQTSNCNATRANELITRFRDRPQGTIPIVVADRVTADARRRLQAAEWSWLDLYQRELYLRAPGVWVQAEVTVPGGRKSRPTAPRRATISSGAGITVAFWLCAHPGATLRPTVDAVELGIAPSTISTAVGQLADAGLVDGDGAGLFPELFWELAEKWQPQRQWLATVPFPEPQNDPASDRQWRLSGTAAAAAMGAPVAAGFGQPLELYVPGPAVLNTTARRYGVSPVGIGPAAVAVAPTSQVLRHLDQALVVDGWPVAPLVAVALDLAIDSGRGREILQEWKHADAVWL
ncbi:MAG: hypothetical protein ABI658_00605 [Acidimicrobiales bacterium]